MKIVPPTAHPKDRGLSEVTGSENTHFSKLLLTPLSTKRQTLLQLISPNMISSHSNYLGKEDKQHSGEKGTCRDFIWGSGVPVKYS